MNLIKGNLVKMYNDLCRFSYCMHDHKMCNICSRNSHKCDKVKDDLQKMIDEGLIRILRTKAEYEEEVNMVYGCPDEFRIYDAKDMVDNLVQLHANFFYMPGQEVHQYRGFQICCRDPRGCSIVRRVANVVSTRVPSESQEIEMVILE